MNRNNTTAGTTAHQATRTGRPQNTGGSNRQTLFTALAPLALLGVWCAGTMIQRTVSEHSAGKTFGTMSQRDAGQVATTLCTQLTGQAPRTQDASSQSAYSRRRGTTIHEWNVLCDTNEGEYLLRINADTQKVYAINRMETEASTASETEGTVSAKEAEAKATAYLRVLGVSQKGLTLVYKSSEKDATTDGQWNFTYRRFVPGVGARLLKVSISGKDGGLEHIWNPVCAL